MKFANLFIYFFKNRYFIGKQNIDIYRGIDKIAQPSLTCVTIVKMQTCLIIATYSRKGTTV